MKTKKVIVHVQRFNSKVYNELENAFKDNKANGNDVTDEFFDSCIDIAKKYTKRNIKFALLKIEWSNQTVDTGFPELDKIANEFSKKTDSFTNRNSKVLFIKSVLEIALEEMSN